MSLSRSNRIALAQDTLAILECGEYSAPSGKIVSLDFSPCLSTTQLFMSNELAALHDNLRDVHKHSEENTPTQFEVCNETTLQGAASLALHNGIGRIGILNFASAKNPGGGFLNGSQAQEESLARSSGLYLSLRESQEFYNAHRASSSLLYSDCIILSPNCPIFRNDDGILLETPYSVTFLTCAAPNAGAIADHRSAEADDLAETLSVRAGKVLALAAHYQLETLILGAWGCGVFRNDPKQVAQTFADYLLPGGVYSQCFRTVRFSIWDTRPPFSIVETFQKLFS